MEHSNNKVKLFILSIRLFQLEFRKIIRVRTQMGKFKLFILSIQKPALVLILTRDATRSCLSFISNTFLICFRKISDQLQKHFCLFQKHPNLQFPSRPKSNVFSSSSFNSFLNFVEAARSNLCESRLKLDFTFAQLSYFFVKVANISSIERRLFFSLCQTFTVTGTQLQCSTIPCGLQIKCPENLYSANKCPRRSRKIFQWGSFWLSLPWDRDKADSGTREG